MKEGSSAFFSECYSTPGFLVWAASGAILKRCKRIVVRFWDMAVNHCGTQASVCSLALCTTGRRGRKHDKKSLACFRPWLCKLTGIWRSRTTSWFGGLCCSLGNTSELCSVGEAGESDSLSLIRSLLPAVVVAFSSVVWGTVRAKALFLVILLRTVWRLTCPHLHLAVELLIVNSLSNFLYRWDDPWKALLCYRSQFIQNSVYEGVFFWTVFSLSLFTCAP